MATIIIYSKILLIKWGLKLHFMTPEYMKNYPNKNKHLKSQKLKHYFAYL